MASEMRSVRDEALLELTRSICPVCKASVDAELNARDGKVFLRKRCDEHGDFEVLAYGDADRYLELQRFNKPGDRPLRLQTQTLDGCPRDCGICPEHRQHSCSGSSRSTRAATSIARCASRSRAPATRPTTSR